MYPECPRKEWPCIQSVPGKKEWRPKSFRLQSTPTGKRPKVYPRTRWPYYISDLGVEPAELYEIAIDREVFRVLLGLLPPRLYPKKKRARK